MLQARVRSPTPSPVNAAKYAERPRSRPLRTDIALTTMSKNCAGRTYSRLRRSRGSFGLGGYRTSAFRVQEVKRAGCAYFSSQNNFNVWEARKRKYPWGEFLEKPAVVQSGLGSLGFAQGRLSTAAVLR